MLPLIGLASGALLLASSQSPPILPFPNEIPSMPKIPNITWDQWIQFAKACTIGPPSTVTPSFRLGIFGFHVRRLVDLGYLTAPKVIVYNGKQVWDAQWVHPYSLETWIKNPHIQYGAFCASISQYLSTAEQYVGRLVDDISVTLSGALGIHHRIGLLGSRKWMISNTERQKFLSTTKYFQRTNHIF